MKRQTSKSSTRSKMVWLLFAAPLLVPALGFVLHQSPQNVSVTYQVAKPFSPSARPYAVLSTSLLKYPHANEFTVVCSDTNSAINLVYNRREQSLIQVFGSSGGESRFQIHWKGVTDNIVYAVERVDSRSMIPVNLAYSQTIDSELKRQGALPSEFNK